MSRDYGIELRIEHYGCTFDILGQAELIEEVFRFIKDMPIEPNAVVWRTILASCRAYKDVGVGEEAFRHITQLEPAHSGDYILLSNIYALVGKSEDALIVRSQMREMGIKKSPGCSLIELGGVVHEFFSEDDKFSHSKEIYRATKEMMERIELARYEPNVEVARVDAEEEDRVVSLSHHSEKLALAFGLYQRATKEMMERIELARYEPNVEVARVDAEEEDRVVSLSHHSEKLALAFGLHQKTLRVCTDCHNAIKIISKLYNRTIIVGDRNRFHHFQEGSCSCNDYW